MRSHLGDELCILYLFILDEFMVEIVRRFFEISLVYGGN